MAKDWLCSRINHNTMSQALFYFHETLNYFLPDQQQGCWIPVQFKGRQSVKHLVEALGVPHPEIRKIEVNGMDSSLSYLVLDGDHISVFPYNAHSRPETGTPIRFILDLHLGKLAVYLRIMGFDSMYQNNYTDDELARLAVETGRTLLTRDRRLLMRKVIQHGYCVRSLDPPSQAREILHYYGLSNRVQPFQRCLRCNNRLIPVAKESVLERLEPLTKKYYDEFHLCPACDQIYWKGSHFEHMQAFLLALDKEK